MMFRCTKPRSSRDPSRVNVETIGGRRSRQLLPQPDCETKLDGALQNENYRLMGPFRGPQADMTPGRTTPKRLPDDAEFRRIRPRAYKVSAAERRKKVVQRHHVRKIHCRKLRPVAHMVGMKQIVVADGRVEQISWRHARRIRVVVLRARR